MAKNTAVQEINIGVAKGFDCLKKLVNVAIGGVINSHIRFYRQRRGLQFECIAQSPI